MDVEKLKNDSEKRFQELCDKSEFAWLYIDQDKNGKFSKLLYENEGKRPDFLVTIPHLGSVFFDVKAKLDRLFYEDSYRKSVPSFNISTLDYIKLEKLQQYTLINVWYAVFPHLKNEITGSCFVVPLNIVSKFVVWSHIQKPKIMKFIQVPKQCGTECSDALSLKVSFRHK